jgi:hypothetical protein
VDHLSQLFAAPGAGKSSALRYKPCSLSSTFPLSQAWTLTAPIHTAKKVKKWFSDNGIEVMNWPPYSPDLNPIEHFWFPLNKGVYQVRSDIDSITGKDDTVRDELFDALEEAWPLIGEQLMKGLIEGMPRRIQACLNAEGWYTKY